MIKASGFRWNSWSGKRPLKQKRRTKRSKYPKDLRVCGSRNLPRKLQVCCPDCIVDRNAHPNTQSGITYFWLHYALPCIWSPLRVFFFAAVEPATQEEVQEEPEPKSSNKDDSAVHEKKKEKSSSRSRSRSHSRGRRRRRSRRSYSRSRSRSRGRRSRRSSRSRHGRRSRSRSRTRRLVTIWFGCEVFCGIIFACICLCFYVRIFFVCCLLMALSYTIWLLCRLCICLCLLHTCLCLFVGLLSVRVSSALINTLARSTCMHMRTCSRRDSRSHRDRDRRHRSRSSERQRTQGVQCYWLKMYSSFLIGSLIFASVSFRSRDRRGKEEAPREAEAPKAKKWDPEWGWM